MVVFALNTLIGFACSVGVDMGFNSQHHNHGKSTEAMMHKSKVAKLHAHHHSTEQSNEGNDDMPAGKKKDCCTGEVKQFHDLDKSVPNVKTLVHPVFLTTFTATYFHLELLPRVVRVKDVRAFVQHNHPPIGDLRIVIQSFQI